MGLMLHLPQKFAHNHAIIIDGKELKDIRVGEVIVQT
jgi:hypothetical protein